METGSGGPSVRVIVCLRCGFWSCYCVRERGPPELSRLLSGGHVEKVTGDGEILREKEEEEEPLNDTDAFRHAHEPANVFFLKAPLPPLVFIKLLPGRGLELSCPSLVGCL